MESVIQIACTMELSTNRSVLIGRYVEFSKVLLEKSI